MIDHATFFHDASGKIVVQGTNKIWVTFAILKSPMLANGYPVVIV